ncbi:hypothetical protein BIV25_39385 [Streptomyces sp. MUSC 14]|nr:ScbA/BarX family gamma-butyrolactone biosynthesis protein [Streptomyces sp. MUSC 14]OIJ87285.1 hypothetical protein BIV25_39385 [Streptomyces sp. MUSC 14]
MSLFVTESDRGTSELPRLTTTVPKEYVHRASLAEVFLTACTAQDDLRFSLSGQWPRAHTHFTSPDGTSHDPLQVAETFRQASMFLAHTELSVPLGHHFVMWDLSYTTDLCGLRIASRPTDFDIEARCTELVQRRGVINRATVQLSMFREGVLVAHGATQFSTITPAVYTRLRAGRPTAAASPVDGAVPDVSRQAMPPSSVNRRNADEVVLSATDHPRRWLLTPNLDHPILFDHGADHIPGMVLLEGARQAAFAAVASPAFVPASASTTFSQYAEFDRPCWIEVTRVSADNDGTMTVEVVGRQDDRCVYTSTITGPVGRQ